MNAEYDHCIAELIKKIAVAEKYENLPYDTATLEKNIHSKVMGIVSGETASDNFYGSLLDHITAYPDRHLEVYLKLLPTKWTYALESLAASKNV